MIQKVNHVVATAKRGGWGREEGEERGKGGGRGGGGKKEGGANDKLGSGKKTWSWRGGDESLLVLEEVMCPMCCF